MRKIRGARDRRDLPGPADLAQSALHDRPAARRDDPDAPAAVGAARRAQRAIELLEEVGIPGAEQPHRPLSAPVLRRHAPARGDRAGARAPSPRLIIADEPTTALDVSIQAQIIALLKRLCREHGTAVMLVTHDMGVIAETADRVAVMYAGRIVEIGPVRDVIHRAAASLHRGPDGLDPVASASERERLAQIDGAMPRLDRDPAGCAFNPRCPRAFERCRVERPELMPAGATPRRLLAARRSGVGAPMPTASCRCLTPLLEVDGPARATSTSRRRGSTACSRAGRARSLQAVDGVDFAIAKGETLRAGRRVGLRQVDGRAADRRPVSRRRAARSSSTATTSRPRAAAPTWPRAAPAHADDLPGPVREPQSALARRRHRRRADPRASASPSDKAELDGAGRRAAAPGRARAGRRREVPAPVLRRPAPAHLDRARARQRARSSWSATSRPRRSTSRCRRRS